MSGNANVEGETIINSGFDAPEDFENVGHETNLGNNEFPQRKVISVDQEFVESLNDLHPKKAIGVDKEFVDTLYDQDFEFVENVIGEDVTHSPLSLKKIAAAVVQNDSGYTGSPTRCDSGEKADHSSVEDYFQLEENVCPILPSSKVLVSENANEDKTEEVRSFAPLLDRCAYDYSFSMAPLVELLTILVVVFSILFMVYMGDTTKEVGTRLSGKRAAIQFYYDSINKNRYCINSICMSIGD